MVLFVFQISYSEEIDPYNSYQWHGRKGEDWYEWWYFKLIDPKTKTPFYFVYGVVNPWDISQKKESSRAMVSIGDFSNHTMMTQNFSPKSFSASRERPLVSIGEYNLATDQKIEGFIFQNGYYARWNLKIKKIRGWQAMGWGMPLKVFNIWWYPAQMDATFSGTIEMNGKVYEIEDADGYQDRNWGTSFPKWWYWMVSNSFVENENSSLASGGGSAATQYGLPLPTAVLIGLYHEDKMYSFRSSDIGNYIDYDIKMGSWNITAIQPNYKIELQASCDLDELMDLEFITPGGQVFHDYETLTGTLSVKLYERSFFRWKEIASLSSIDTAGLELGLDREL